MIIAFEIPWAGIAACLAAVGSLLSGIAAYKMATRKDKDEPEHKDSGPDS